MVNFKKADRLTLRFRSIYILAFCTTVILAVVLLAITAHLPQTLIDANVEHSAQIMILEGAYLDTLDHTWAGRLDNWTDALMLMESKAMTSDDMATILVNPLFDYGKGTPVDNLYEYVKDDAPVSSGGYVRYWMGFRVILRLLLVFFNYYQIKRYVAFMFFVLFSVLLCIICKKIGSKEGIVFAISVILIRPYVVCYSLQFSCCFLIAFAAMFLVLWVDRYEKWEKVYFMEVGMITMYFDFYTTPIITLGMPLIFLYLLRNARGKITCAKQILSDSAAWFVGYGFMWIAKLVLTTIFTSNNALENGFNSMRGWLLVNENGQNVGIWNVVEAYKNIAMSVFSDKEGFITGLLIIVVLLVRIVRLVCNGTICWSKMLQNKCILLITLMPIIWFAVAARPTAGHFWFQYRGIVVSYWGIFSLLLIAFKTNKQTHVIK